MHTDIHVTADSRTQQMYLRFDWYVTDMMIVYMHWWNAYSYSAARPSQGGHKEMSSILADQERPCIRVQMRGDGGGRGLRGLSQWVQLCTVHHVARSPNKLWRSNFIFSLWACSSRIMSAYLRAWLLSFFSHTLYCICHSIFCFFCGLWPSILLRPLMAWCLRLTSRPLPSPHMLLFVGPVQFCTCMLLSNSLFCSTEDLYFFLKC